MQLYMSWASITHNNFQQYIQLQNILVTENI